MLMNLLATPGLGSLMAGRVVAGTLQLFLAVAGFVFVVVWFWVTMKNYYGQMFVGEEVVIQRSAPLAFLINGGILFGLAWIWSLFTSLSLMRRAKIDEVAVLKASTASGVKLDEAKIQSALAVLPQWQRTGPMIARTFEFADFVAAMKFVNAVAELAEAAQHGPDIDIRWNKVTLALTTHDSGGLTEKDFALARQCDALT